MIDSIRTRPGLVPQLIKNNEKLYGVFEPVPENEERMRWEVPSVEIQVTTQKTFADPNMFARAHFYENGRLVQTLDQPAQGYLNTKEPFGLPPVFSPGRPQTLFFPIPFQLRNKSWTVVIVMGTEKGAVARVFPGNGAPTTYDFPERQLVMGGSALAGNAEAGPEAGGIIEFVAKTRSVKQPQITLFFRLPPGVSKISELHGLLARVRLGDSVDDVRESFLRESGDPKPGTILELAKKYKLGLLYWGSRNLWTKNRNAEELPDAVRKAESAEFDLVAEGWERGLDAMAAKYGIPKTNIIIEGESQAAQWSHRLVLRKPERFLAIHAHVSSSYDMPTRQGASAMWLVTTGEQEPGCEGAMAFYTRCRSMGYPMIFKAEPGLGHEPSPMANALGYQFFDWVLQNAAAANFDPRATRMRLLAGFQRPAWVGDFSTQEFVSSRDVADLEPDALVPLPTREIADAWSRQTVK